MVVTFSMKLWWRFREQGSLWAEYMYQKYCHSSSPAEVKPVQRSSPTWKRMLQARSKTQQQLRWSIGGGTTDFWDDIWLNEQPLRSICHKEDGLERRVVRDFWTDNRWDETKIRATLLPLGVGAEVVEQILAVPIDASAKDAARWNATPHGNFSTSSAWNLIRHQQERVEVFGLIWSPAISPSMSIFVWRLLVNRIPVDAKLKWRKIQLASRCRCCMNPRIETREHLFIQGEAADNLWSHFAGWFADAPTFPRGETDIERRIRWWHSKLGRYKGDHVSMTIPCMILWFIWTERNNVIHRGAKFNIGMVKERIHNHLQWAILARKIEGRQWKGTEPTVEFSFPRMRKNRTSHPSIVRWTPPQPNWIKLNSNGTFQRATNQAGEGGIIRNEQREILEGFTGYFDARSSTEAELHALLLGIVMARKHGTNIWMEVDAQEIVGTVERGDRGPAEFRHIITEIRNNLRGCRYKISHIHREGNMIAEYLAKQGGMARIRNSFSREDAPHFIKALARMDQLGLPNFREVD